MKIKINKLSTLLMITGVLAIGSCREDKNKNHGQGNIEQEHLNQISADIKEDLLLGSWLDTSESALHFSLLPDGSARSDNMATLLYEKWRLEGTNLILTVKSIGNGSSSTTEEVYQIHTLTEKKMTLRDRESVYNYVRKK
tara:strand:+ start:140 stop:559 length:420 start_codon:yes stop_codon:yes gene_type:complete